MKRTVVPILVFALTFGIGLSVTRLLLHHQSSQTVPLKPSSEPIAKRTNTVSYKGVSFTFDPALAAEVKWETTPAMVDGKPCDIVPEHPAFTFVGYRVPKGLSDSSAQVRVFPIAKFREAIAAASKEHAKNVEYPPNPPAWTVYFDEEVRTLKALLDKRPLHERVTRFISKVRSDKHNTQMPFLPMWEAGQAFVSHLKYVNFKNGKGVFFLTQWDTDTTQVTNEGLEYAFQGITDDGQHYVYAEFSVAAPFLPAGSEPDVVAWTEKNYLLRHQSKEYQSYLRPVLAKLEALPADKFQPDLELIEKVIQSVEIQER